ncbi:RNA polymerase sigma-70 factor [Pedobacter nyackensis]|uniref:RNA polymerase sigma factor n=1 Tax=Pedobacter nyackensis TaxID=475255 RepID=UPI00292DC4B9|nr:RNA polymerase sigma-70 factor [Pedobacter nyackensis]
MTDYCNFTDQELTVLLKNGNHSAFTEIYHRYKRLLYTHAYQRLRNEQEVDDIIHELFTTLWLKRDTLVFKTNLSGYLYTAIRNRILDYVAHQKIESAYISSFASFLKKSEDFTDFLLREKQLEALIDKEIAALPPKMREVFELSRKENLSHEEIASRLGITKKTVKSQVNNALKTLRSKLSFTAWLFFILFY